MECPTVSELIPMLQMAIGPAILISGTGLLLLMMVNRLHHVVDRARILVAQAAESSADLQGCKVRQLAILWRRAHLIRAAIGLVSASALFAALLIVAIFLAALFRLEMAWLMESLFILAMLSLILAFLFFMLDVNQSLAALGLELKGQGQREPSSPKRVSKTPRQRVP